jgi:primosomal protein N''
VFYLFLLFVGVAGIGIYLLFMFNLVPGMAEERLGVLEALPEETGSWKIDSESPAAQAAAREGLVREVRHYFYEARGRLVLQARYRRRDTNEIVRVEPEVAVKRRRIRS